MKRSTFRRLRNSSARPLAAFLALLLGGRSWSTAQRVGARLGTWASRLARRDRDRAVANLEIAFPDVEAQWREALVRESFRHFGMSLTEVLHLSRRPPGTVEEHLEVEGWEHVQHSAAEGRGALIATAHCGNWELFGPVFQSRETPLAAIVRHFEESWVDEQISALRQRLGTELIHRGEPGSARQLLKIFRGRGNLLVLIDHDIDADSVWVPFFGRAAHTVIGPAQMAIRHSLAVIPAFCERLEDGRHIVRFEPPLDIGSDPEEATALMTRAVEDQIRRCPAQWTWMHQRWRRRPPAEERA